MSKVFFTSIFLLLFPIITVASDFSWAELPSKDNTDYSALSCRELYTIANQIAPNTKTFRSTIVNEQSDRLLTVIGTVYEPGLYYLGYSTVKNYVDNYRRVVATANIDHVRQYMAARNCFLK